MMGASRTTPTSADDTETITVTTPTTTPESTVQIPEVAKALVAACLAGLLLAPAAGAQVCGDVTADNKITTADALNVLKAAVDQPVTLICQDQCAVLEARIAALEALLANVTVDGNKLVLTGMNFQVVSGSGDTDGAINGTGNIIIGYDEKESGDKKTGSHNLVIGRFHSYPTWGGIVAGENNTITGVVASVLGGVRNSANDDGAVVVGGVSNRADGETSVVVAGENNRTSGRSCAVASGTSNLCSGIAGAVSGGSQNTCSGNSAAIGGASSRILGSNLAWQAGNLGPVF